MLVRISALALLAGAAGACSAPAVDTALAPNNPASVDAPVVPFLWPANVLTESGTPATAVPSTAMTMSPGSMGGMDHGSMSGMNHDMAGMAGMDHAATGQSGMAGMQTAQAGNGQAAATGKVNAVNAADRTVNVSHDPIKALGWPSMTMDFPVARSVDLSKVKPGTRISFTLGRSGPDSDYQIVTIRPADGASGQPGMSGGGQSMPGMDHSSMPGMSGGTGAGSPR